MIQRLRELRSQGVGSDRHDDAPQIPPHQDAPSSSGAGHVTQEDEEEDEGEEEEEEEGETPSKRLFLLSSAQKTAGGAGAVPVRLLPDPVFQASPEPGLREAGARGVGGAGLKRKAGREGGKKAKQKLNFQSLGAEQRKDPGSQPASSSSWAEQSSMVIGTNYRLSPLTTAMEQRLILQYLMPLGDYQEVRLIL